MRIEEFKNNKVVEKLLECGGNIECILYKLDKMYLYACDFTLEEVGLILNVTKERVRQIENSAIKKLKHPKIGRLLKGYMEC